MITGKYLLIGSQYMHPAHYRCTECGKEFVGGDSHEFEGELYCKPVCSLLSYLFTFSSLLVFVRLLLSFVSFPRCCILSVFLDCD
jgi:DNA-directed RNA polymerase subunit RPC12/RpoP